MAGSSLRNPRRNSIYAFAVDAMVVVAATLLTALLALVVEDALPLADDTARFDPARVGFTILAFVFLGLAIALRQRRIRFRGTLYYVRYLGEFMEDVHFPEYESGRPGHRDARVVTQWMTASPRDGVIDIADDVTDISKRLESTMNNDEASTAFNLAPNLLWPAALALGYELYGWPELKLEEAKSTGGGLSWSLDPTRKPKIRERPVIWSTESHVPADAVLVSARITNGPDLVGTGLPFRRTVEIAVSAGRHSSYDDAPTTEPVVDPDRVRVTLSDASWLTSSSSSSTAMDPAVVTDAIVSTIFGVLHDHPDSPILLYLRVPKTVALAVGMRLAEPTERFRRCSGKREHFPWQGHPCWHPWRRLIPVMLDQEQPAATVLCRVHPAQPCTQILKERARRGRIDSRVEELHRAHCDCLG